MRQHEQYLPPLSTVKLSVRTGCGKCIVVRSHLALTRECPSISMSWGVSSRPFRNHEASATALRLLSGISSGRPTGRRGGRQHSQWVLPALETAVSRSRKRRFVRLGESHRLNRPLLDRWLIYNQRVYFHILRIDGLTPELTLATR
jgi:hypothetical protein